MTLRNRNLTTALILASIALVFFAGIFVKYWIAAG
ncbi:MAG: cytochrome oxidase small assembly protein [Burkholderiaceae bacterium]